MSTLISGAPALHLGPSDARETIIEYANGPVQLHRQALALQKTLKQTAPPSLSSAIIRAYYGRLAVHCSPPPRVEGKPQRASYLSVLRSNRPSRYLALCLYAAGLGSTCLSKIKSSPISPRPPQGRRNPTGCLSDIWDDYQSKQGNHHGVRSLSL